MFLPASAHRGDSSPALAHLKCYFNFALLSVSITSWKYNDSPASWFYWHSVCWCGTQFVASEAVRNPMTEAIEKCLAWSENAGIQRKAGWGSEIDIEMYLASAALVLIICYSFKTHLHGTWVLPVSPNSCSNSVLNLQPFGVCTCSSPLAVLNLIKLCMDTIFHSQLKEKSRLRPHRLSKYGHDPPHFL